MALKIEQIEQNGHNGHITVHCRVVSNDGNGTVEGARETHGIDPVVLQDMYGGDVMTFLRAAHYGMRTRHEGRQVAFQQLRSLQGKVIDLEGEDENGNGQHHPE